MEISIPLKLKYRLHKASGSFKSKSSNTGTKVAKIGQTLKSRRKAYGPF